jgi:hypothetical protein
MASYQNTEQPGTLFSASESSFNTIWIRDTIENNGDCHLLA